MGFGVSDSLIEIQNISTNLKSSLLAPIIESLSRGNHRSDSLILNFT